jgi:hypothetical protein
LCEVLASRGVGKQSVVSDAHQAGRKDVEQEPAKKLLHVEGHESVRIASGPVFPAEGHILVLECDESSAGDGDAVGVAAEIAQDLPRPREGRFAVDDPVSASGGAESSVRFDIVAAQGAVVDARLEPS